MTATDVINQLRTLSPQEVVKVRTWLMEHDNESPQLLAAIDAGVCSLDQRGAQIVNREELEQKVRLWASASR